MNKGQKLVKMLELMSRTGGVRATELAERFELDPRTLRRYLADLRELHLPIEDKERGDERVLELDPQWRRTGVQLTLGEMLSLHFGRTLFTFLEDTQFGQGMQAAIERLQPSITVRVVGGSNHTNRRMLVPCIAASKQLVRHRARRITADTHESPDIALRDAGACGIYRETCARDLLGELRRRGRTRTCTPAGARHRHRVRGLPGRRHLTAHQLCGRDTPHRLKTTRSQRDRSRHTYEKMRFRGAHRPRVA